MKILKLLVSRFLIVFLMIALQLALYFSVWYYLEKRYVWLSMAIDIIAVIVIISIIGRNQPAVYKLPWIIAILLLPFAGITLFLMFGQLNLSKKFADRFKDVYEVTQNAVKEPDEELKNSLAYGQSSYILNTCHLPAFRHCYNEYLPTGEIFFNKLEDELLKAERYIMMEYFIVEKGFLWNQIFSILKNKIQQGVKIYFMYDDIGSISKFPRNFYMELKKEGINAVVFNKFVPITSSVHNNRDHRKITIIDGKTAFTGGANIADEYINVTHPFGKWKDSGIMIKGQAVDSFVALFLQNYNVMVRNPLHIDEYVCKEHETFEEKGFVQPYGDGPRPIFNHYVGRDIYLNIINQSKKYLYITTPYLIVDFNILEALCNASKRGVDVRLITPHIPDKKSIYLMTKSNYTMLIKEGVKVYEYKPGFIHAKTFVCDDEYGVVGTVNLDYRSFLHHYECGVWMYKTESIKPMKQDFLEIVKNESLEMNLKNSHLNPIMRFIRNALNLFAPLL